MPYRYNPFTGELDLTEDVTGFVDTINADTGTAEASNGELNLLGDATQGSVTSATGNTVTITNTSATETQIGVSELATNAEAIAGTDTVRTIVPTALKAKLGSQTDNGIAFGNGDSNAIEWTSALTDGMLAIGSTAGSPAAANITTTTGLTITNGSNTIAINASAAVPLSFPADTGSATPASNALTVAGGTGMDTSGSGSTITINFDVTEVASIATSFPTDSGTATPSTNSLTIAGGTGMDTSGTGSTVTVAFDITEVANIATSFAGDTGTATPATNSLTIAGDATQGSVTSATGSTVTITNTSATESQIGVSAYATDAETITGTISNKAVVPSSLDAKLGTTQPTNSLAYSQGDTSAFGWTTALTNGEIVIGNTSGSPTASTITPGTGIGIVNAANSITINASATTPLSFPTDTGTATPAANALTIAGGTGMDTSGAGSIVTIAFDVTEVASIATSFAGDTGTATPATNALTIAGGTGMDTSGAGSTVTVAFDVTEVASIATSFAGDTGTATPATNTLTIAGGTGVDTSATGSTVTIDVDLNEAPTIPTTFETNSGDAIPALNTLSIVGTTTQGISSSGSGSVVTVTAANATESQKGVVTLATNGAAIIGTNSTDAITPTSLKAKLGDQIVKGIAFGQDTASTIEWTAGLSDGMLAIGSTAGVPTASTLTAGTGISIVNGTGSITIANTGMSQVDLISTATASNDSSVEFTGLNSTYYMYEVIITDLQSDTAAVTFDMRTSTNDGSSFDSGATDYGWLNAAVFVNTSGSVTSALTGDSTANSMVLTGTDLSMDLDSDTNEEKTMHVYIYNPSDASIYTHIMAEYEGFDNSSNLIQGATSKNMRKTAGDVDGIQFFMSSGNIETGTFELYGLRAT